ncbi:DUF4064 domain-containing protein [Metabacillus mangrovi]|nr:DUF4064 domain-containing protein [Metabacillus mangrovi]
MKRVAETVMTVIGMILFGILVLGSLLFHFIFANSEQLKASGSFTFEENIPGFSEEQVMDFMSGGALFIAAAAAVCTVLGLVSLLLLKSRPGASAVLSIVAGAAGIIFTAMIGFVGGVLYIAAGIMILVKSKRASASLHKEAGLQ